MATKPPRIDPAVVDWLASVFPDKCPTETDSDRAIWIAVGAQKVVKKMRAIAGTQSGNVLDEES